MQLLDQYKSIIYAFCNDREDFIKNYSSEYESDLLKLLIYSLKLDFDNYQKIMESIDVDQIKLNSIENLLILEGKIRYLSKTKSKIVFLKENSPIANEFIELCNHALSIFPYAFIASTAQAFRFEMQKKYKQAIPILVDIYDYGFRARFILDSLIYNSVAGREWIVAGKYVNFVQPGLNNLLTKAFIIFYRYPIIAFCFGFYSFFIPFQQYWYFSVIVLLFFSLIILYTYFHQKNRSMLILYVFFNFLFLFPSVVGLLLKLLGFG